MSQRWVEGLVCVWLAGCILAFMVASWHWPLTGDASLMHYVVFLMHRGMEPYRDIVDMNLPLSYMVEGSVISVLGPGSMGWRIYDFVLSALSAISLLVILRPRGWLPGLLAAALFVLIHGRDGALMDGERDFAAAVLLLSAVAMLFVLLRRGRRCAFAAEVSLLAGLAVGMALMIKPPLFLVAIGLVWWARSVTITQEAEFRRLCGWALCGASLPFAASVAFLVHHHALTAFWGEMHGLIPYHASIDNFSAGHLLGAVIQPMLFMLLLWLLALYGLQDSEEGGSERIALILCAAGGLLSYLIQGKAFWYQRYPFLAFVLPIFMIDFHRLLRVPSRSHYIGVAGMATGVVLATTCLLHLQKYDRTEPPRQMLRDLLTLGTPAALSGHIQCMDTIGGCIDALYAARIVQSTGSIYDCYMLDGNNAVALDLRRRFWDQMNRKPPQVIVITDSDCYAGARSFARFGRWPEFQQYLDANFVLERESGPLPPVLYWSHPMEAYQYRIYVRR